MNITIPHFALVLLMGPMGAGKSTFAAKHFRETEIVSSDRCRALVSDDEGDQSATADAFYLVGAITRLRLKRRKLTVVDATSVNRTDRGKLIRLGQTHDASIIGFALDIDPALCAARNRGRPNRPSGMQIPHQHSGALRSGLAGLKAEGFDQVRVLRTVEEVDAVTIHRADTA